MAESKKIKGSDLIAPNFLTDAIEQSEKFLKIIKETKNVIVATNKATTKKLSSAKGSSSADLKEQNKLLAESAKQRTLIVKAEEAELTALTKLNKAKQAAIDFEKKKLAVSEKEKKAIEQQNSAYAQASKRLNDLRKQYKDLAVAGKSADIATHNMLMEIQKLDKELKEVDASVGQFNRSVGDYKNQVSEAITETGLFTEGLGKLGAQQNEVISSLGMMFGQLKKVTEAQEAAAVSSNKLNKVLKFSGIALVVTALAAMFAFFTQNREGALEFDKVMNKLKGTLDIILGSIGQIGRGLVGLGKAAALAMKLEFKEAAKVAEEATKDLSTAFDGNFEKIGNQIDAYDALTREIFAYEDALRKLQIQLDRAKMDEEDYNEIQADTTISLNKQKAALDGAIQSRLEAAKLQKQIADQELEIATKQLQLELRKSGVTKDGIKLIKEQGYEAFLNSKLTLKVSEDALQKLQEKFLAQESAADALDDLDRQETERRRQMIQDETINNIELIRSKKLGADEQVKILTKQVEDEKFQLEERERFNAELRQKQLAARDEEIKLLGTFGLKQQEVLDLINEKDQVKLANALKNLRATRLSQAATDELAKVIFEQQTATIEYEEQLKKFEDEKIKREEKLLSLTREISIINEQSRLDSINQIENERQKALEESNKKILESNNAFNKKLIADRRKASEETSAIITEEFKTRKDILDKQNEIDKDNIKNSVNDEKIRQKELEKVQANYDANLKKLQQEESDKKKALLDSEIEQIRLIEIRKTEIIVEALQKATDALSAELDKRQALELDRQRDLAARGLANTLAFQEAQLDKELLRQQDLERRQAKQKENLALAEALLNAYNAELKQPNANPTTAAAKALGDVLLFKGLAAGLVQFAAEGNDDVQGPGTTKSDSIPFMLSKHEGVVKAEANMNNPGVVASLNNDTFDQMYMPKYDLSKDVNQGTAGNIAASLALQSNKEIIGLLKEINSKPVQMVDVDKMGNLIETVYANGVKTVIKHKNKRSIG
jgi:hypothetical protein